tara:strand:- start:319 stop:708 length:390 start_codon:yes stop_codon:yes gene_type:complete
MVEGILMSEEEGRLITAFIPVFRQKLERLRVDLKEELSRAKSDRRKDVMKKMVSEAKGLKKLCDKADKQDGVNQRNNPCFVCGGELIWGGDHDLEEDETHFDGHKIITNLSCSNNNCNAYVEYYHGGRQ